MPTCAVALARGKLRRLTKRASGFLCGGYCCQHLHQFTAGILRINGVQKIRYGPQVNKIKFNVCNDRFNFLIPSNSDHGVAGERLEVVSPGVHGCASDNAAATKLFAW